MGMTDKGKKDDPRGDKRLLPCPFCGAQAQIECWHGGPETKKMVSCSNDWCPVGPKTTGDTPREAISNWNTRA